MVIFFSVKHFLKNSIEKQKNYEFFPLNFLDLGKDLAKGTKIDSKIYLQFD